MGIHTLADMVAKKANLIDRQSGLDSKKLLDYLLEKAGINKDQLSIADKAARTEMDVGLAISNGKADVGIAVRSVARQLHLDSVSERKIRSGDASIDYFEPPIQHFLPAIQTPAFIELDRELGGYDITGLMKVVLNMR